MYLIARQKKNHRTKKTETVHYKICSNSALLYEYIARKEVCGVDFYPIKTAFSKTIYNIAKDQVNYRLILLMSSDGIETGMDRSYVMPAELICFARYYPK